MCDFLIAKTVKAILNDGAKKPIGAILPPIVNKEVKMYTNMKFKEPYGLLLVLLLSIGVTTIGVITREQLFVTDIAMLYLLINIISGAILKPKAAYTVCFLNIVTFHYFILPDFNSFKFEEVNYVATYFVLAASGIFAIRLTQSQRRQIFNNEQLKNKLKIHYKFARKLSAIVTSEQIAWEATTYLKKKHGIESAIFVNTPQRLLLAKSQKFSDEWLDDITHDTLPTNLASLELKNGEATIGAIVLPNSKSKKVNTWFLSLVSMSLARASAMQALTEAEATNKIEKIRTTLLASVSHDLKTPLGTIIGTATTLSDPTLNVSPDVRDELLHSIASEGERLNQSLNKLLDITRYTSGTFELSKEWAEPEELIGSALQRLKNQLSNHNLVLSGEPMLIEIDGLLIEQVISNLVENSTKYSPENSDIFLKYQYVNGEFVMVVSNQGEPIPEYELTRIFERFYRLENNHIDGTGLGLAICHVIVSAHGGTISAQNNSELGICFEVRIPCRIYDLEDCIIDE